MGQGRPPNPVKLICGLLACDLSALDAARTKLAAQLGPLDLISETWPFEQSDYYTRETGPAILRQFVVFDKLIDPGHLARIKHITNHIEQDLIRELAAPWPRPVNIDPGLIEPSKLVLASTKNFANRIYIGEHIYAEVTLAYVHGAWQAFPCTFPDFRSGRYDRFLTRARQRLITQLRI
ncbi:DUF4416 family protein [Desulfobulbus alkaliphilus]|uniref:DUF4416 family protein n=1 Tax=Desulfobulbus alkaliphilus TaxID=869814 RepID=UPI0019630503|nr:DUF4416 family protein [Desulfobulbus alkaliphilus]MBM9537521.1 DUF4416 family protein [Desulfobulbus alkaliphilus]